ncbi:SdrD B-like domain-containing protein [Streptomyces atriruber]|uniref:SdrD B-like domain-containing protein n=1 Tax=Streptomyces atriruber TaxID=545121 RepID=UPI000AD77BD0|nr:SdrD B-like domain-containing protein [Streptomyces atriruber]
MEQLIRRRALHGMTMLLTAATASAGLPAFAADPVARDAGDGSVKVRVVRAVDANGEWDRALEPGMSGVEVVLTDAEGRSIKGKTGANGVVNLAPGTKLRGGKYRVEAKNPKPGVLFAGFAQPKDDLSDPNIMSSNTEFVNLKGGKDVEFTTSFWNPGDYCQKNAELVTACIGKDIEGFEDPDDTRTLVGFPYNARGVDDQTTNLSDKATTGALYGIGWSKQKKWIFSGAMARRAAKYGPGGPGAIYLTDRESQQTSLFTKVPNVGNTPHDMSQPDMDVAFGKAVAKESLGDVEVTEDGKDLFVVNLNDRKLYRYDATKKTASKPKASYKIPNPGCAAAGDWRPYGLGVQDGKVYVGGVCSAESSQKKSDMRAVVQTFSPKSGTFTGTVMDEKLDFPRGIADTLGGNCKGAGWFPWADGWRDEQDGGTCGRRHAYPQPILGDIVVDTDGDLILGFRDRYGDQTGHDLRGKPGGGLVEPSTGGDLNRACKKGGKFYLDGNGGCPNRATPANSGGQPADVKEYYPGDHRASAIHKESAFSGIALSKVEDTIATSGIDVNDEVFVSGTMFVNRFDGNRADGLGNRLTNTFGKGGAMADLEVLCDEAPFQIGNRVWYDNGKRMKNGIQDPDEKPVVGATVNLYDAQKKKIGTAKTNKRGEYYFDSTLVKNVAEEDWKYGRKYFVRMDHAADYAKGGVLYGYKPAQFGNGGNMAVDSNGKPYGNGFSAADVKIDGAGENDHDVDFGFHKPTNIILTKVSAQDRKPVMGAVFQLWKETNGTKGLQRKGKADKRLGECATDAKGKCTFPKIMIGSYYLVETATPEGFIKPVGRAAVTGPLKVTEKNCEFNPLRVTLKNKPEKPIKKK